MHESIKALPLDLQGQYKNSSSIDDILNDLKRLHANSGNIFSNLFWPMMKLFVKSHTPMMMIATAREICHRFTILRMYDCQGQTDYCRQIPCDVLQHLENICFTESWTEKYHET